VRCSGENCEGCCARPAGATKSNLVERDAKGDKWPDRVKVLDLVGSTPRGRV
jgi:hypothetical protein